MNKEQILLETEEYTKKELTGESTGHDWWHVYRVWQLAKRIAEAEKADTFIVEMAVLLHDIADHKFHNGDHEVGVTVSRTWMEDKKMNEETIVQVLDCIRGCSFSSGHEATTIESQIVQDADRLDAIGAIGIARVFATGTHFKQILFDPTLPREDQKTDIGHFYGKMLKLKDKMNTETGRAIAGDRHAYLEQYLERFYKEWEGEK